MQAKGLMTSVIRPDIYFGTLDLHLNIFQDFVLAYFKKTTVSTKLSTFQTFPGSKRSRKSPLNVLVKLF